MKFFLDTANLKEIREGVALGVDGVTTNPSLVAKSLVNEEILMSRRRIIDERDEGGNTSLMRAALDGQTETVEALLLSGADVNARNREGRTALMFAAINLHTSTVRTLLKFGADVNIQADCGCTALRLAAVNNDILITRLLLEGGADPTVCRPGKTALGFAIERGYTAIVELLKRALAEATQAKSKSLRSNVTTPTRTEAVAATK